MAGYKSRFIKPFGYEMKSFHGDGKTEKEILRVFLPVVPSEPLRLMKYLTDCTVFSNGSNAEVTILD